MITVDYPAVARPGVTIENVHFRKGLELQTGSRARFCYFSGGTGVSFSDQFGEVSSCMFARSEPSWWARVVPLSIRRRQDNPWVPPRRVALVQRRARQAFGRLTGLDERRRRQAAREADRVASAVRRALSESTFQVAERRSGWWDR